MTATLTISNDPLDPGMDYTRLRDEGQQLIARLAGRVWTDYNVTDPGITLLESLCYVITDLSYRLGFDIQDLLVANPDSGSVGKQFFSAGEILSVNPLTVTDYRKLLIDMNGVRNAWLEKAETTATPVVYDPETVSISFPFAATGAGQVRRLNGLYRVLVEPDGAEERSKVIEQVQKRLHRFRNVGEDFSEILVLDENKIAITGNIEIHDGADVNALLADVYNCLNDYLSPSLRFYTLDERLASGRSIDDIFAGPVLEHGFLDDEELSGFQRRTELHSADIITMLLDIDGISAVRELRLSQGGQSPVAHVLDISDFADTRPVLKSISQFLSDGDIIFSTHQGTPTALPDRGIVINKVTDYQARQRKAAQGSTEPREVRAPAGRYRNLTDFVSVQNELPANYGIGRHGLPDAASELRQAQARQLQAYLMVFDQLLVNYLAQLASTRELFAVEPARGIATGLSPQPTYFSAVLPAEVSGAEDIIKDYRAAYLEQLAAMVTDPEVDTDRMNRFLDHLLARHGQDFTSTAALYPTAQSAGDSTGPVPAPVQVIPAKQRFLQDCVDVSHNRARGFNYTDSNTWNTGNVAGLKKRISRLLDIRDFSRRSLANPANPSDRSAEGFHLVDHILLRPDLPKGHVIFAEHTRSGAILCVCRQEHGLQDNDVISFTRTSEGHYQHTLYSVRVVAEHRFYILGTYVSPRDRSTPETGYWVSELQTRDRIMTGLNRIDQIVQGTYSAAGNYHTTAFTAAFVYELHEGNEVIISGAGPAGLNGLHRVINVRSARFEIDVPFDSSWTTDSWNAGWYRTPVLPDPYSCQLSFIFPAAIGRARTDAGGQRFRDLVAEVIKTEVPAHITPNLYWFENTDLVQFETAYQAWLTAKAQPQSNGRKIDTTRKAIRILEWLGRYRRAFFDVVDTIPGLTRAESAKLVELVWMLQYHIDKGVMELSIFDAEYRTDIGQGLFNPPEKNIPEISDGNINDTAFDALISQVKKWQSRRLVNPFEPRVDATDYTELERLLLKVNYDVPDPE